MASWAAVAALAVQAYQAAAATTNVVVIGSGVSGLSAARTLLDNWPTTGDKTLSITVLEAANRIGGRTYTRRSVPDWGAISGAEADVGASWIHGSCPDHPITRIYDALGLTGFVTEDSLDQVFQCEEGEDDECDELEDSGFDDYEELVGRAEEYAEEHEGDISVWEALGRVSGDEDDDDISRNNPVMQYHTANALEFNTGASPSDLSGKNSGDDLQYEGEERLILQGYGKVPEALADGTIRLSAVCKALVAPEATKITSEKVAIDVRKNKPVKLVRKTSTGLEVVTNDDAVIQADQVIVSVPLGVLKRGTITFTPELPAATKSAIEKVGFGDVVKIGLLFNRPFWSNDMHYYGIAPTGPGSLTRAERFSYFLNAGAAAERPILFTFAFGASAMAVEALSDADVKEAIMANLYKIFGEDNMDEVSIVSMWRSSWGTDPLFGGAYSFGKVGSTRADWEALASPAMDDKLHFAGEHTSREYRGTVHGALFSGQRAACEIFEEVFGAAFLDQFTPGATTTRVRTTTTRATRTTTTTRTATTTAAPANVTGSMTLTVEDPAAFAASAAARRAVVQGLGDVAHVKSKTVEVTLSAEGARRLGAHERALAGTVNATYRISIRPGSKKVSGPAVISTLSATTATASLGTAISNALQQRGLSSARVASAPTASLTLIKPSTASGSSRAAATGALAVVAAALLARAF